jgi:hypothetical protein
VLCLSGLGLTAEVVPLAGRAEFGVEALRAVEAGSGPFV